MLAGLLPRGSVRAHIKARKRHGKVPSTVKNSQQCFFYLDDKGLFSCSLLSDSCVYAVLIKSLWKQHEEQILKSLPAVPRGLSADGFDIIAPDDLFFVVQPTSQLLAGEVSRRMACASSSARLSLSMMAIISEFKKAERGSRLAEPMTAKRLSITSDLECSPM